MSQERMELWSNDVLTEFTIKFNSVIAVTTSNNPDTIVKMIDECPFDWHYSFSVGCLLFGKQIYCFTGLQNLSTKRVQYSRR